MADNKKMVEAITSMEEDFAKWYTDVVKKAELIDYSSVRGCMILRPYGYAIWEHIQHWLDSAFKATGHENVYMPMLIPAKRKRSCRRICAGGGVGHPRRQRKAGRTAVRTPHL